MGSDTTKDRVVTGDGGGVTTMLRAALPSLPLVGQLPGIRKAGPDAFTGLAVSRPPVEVRRTHVEQYAEVCGFPRKDTVPITYPHLLAFPLHMAIMSDQEFPAPAIGTVHLSNSVIAHRPVLVGETLAVRAHVGPPRAHPKGQVFDFVTEARERDVDGALVWQSTSSYLRRGHASSDTAATANRAQDPELPPSPSGGVSWRLPADLGRRYASVSGDHNPIHLYALTARPLGFKRQIAHGMWSKARCVAAIENRLPDAVRIEVAFKKPILLPATVRFGTEPTPDGHAFALTDPRSGAPHVVGAATAL